MAQGDSKYFATYCKLDADSEELHADVNGDAVAVGLQQQFEREDYINDRGKERTRGIVRDARGQLMGFLPANYARRVCDLLSDGWTVRVCASAVGFHEADRSFWVEVAVFAYEPEYADALGAFVDGSIKRLSGGDRPDIRLSEKMIEEALADKKFYKTVRNTSYPKQGRGDVYYKRHRTNTENIIISGSERKPGCIVGTVLFYVVLAAIIAVIVYFVFFR